MPTALDRKFAYYASQILSPNVALTDEGFLICRNVVIGRTGYQTYKFEEIDDPEQLLEQHSSFGPGDEIPLWRDPSEVFSPETISSFEGKTFTLTHPDRLLNPDTERDHYVGHVQNVRKGSESLESGDWPLIGDVLIKVREGLDAYDRGIREVSCGYSYKLARTGYRWEQTEIRGNHVALVEKGRAGAEARINDAAPAVPPAKEQPVNLKSIFAGWAKTAKQEDVEAALSDNEVATALTGRSIATDAVAAKDSKKEEVSVKNNLVVVGEDGKKFRLVALDEEKEEKESGAKDDGMEEENTAAADARKKYHDALDRMLDAKESTEEEKKAAEDATMGELRDMFGEKKAKDGHPADCGCDECTGKSEDAKDEEEEKSEEEKEESEDAEIVRAEPVLKEGELPKNALDRAAFDASATLEILKTIRPAIAATKDRKAISQFDNAFQTLRKAAKGVKADRGDYSRFVERTRTLDKTEINERKTARDTKDGAEKRPRESAYQRSVRENDEMFKAAGLAQLGKSSEILAKARR